MICPNCIEELIKDKKKLGQVKNWLVCPKCGYRTREWTEKNAEIEERSRLIENRKINNITGGKHEQNDY